MTAEPRVPPVRAVVPAGSGAIVVHRQLEARLAGYQVQPYSPWTELFPPLMRRGLPPATSLVHACADYASVFCRPGRRVIATVHGYVLDAAMRPYTSLGQHLHRQGLMRRYLLRSLRQADVITVVSRSLIRRLQDDLGCTRPMQFVGNGVDTDRFRPRPPAPATGPLRVLVSGNQSRRKGAHWVPSIAGRAGQTVQLQVAGRLTPEQSARLQAAGVQVLGAYPHEAMPDLYRTADALLMPTVREGMSLALLEAMASGLPVVASALPEIAELVTDGEGGWLCAPGDVEGFAERLRWLAEHPSEAQRMGATNRARALKEFTVGQMAGRYADLFRQLV